ncbi:hypothetical protein D3C72_2223730 [compost metagenome]
MAVDADIVVIVPFDRIARQDRVAVMAFGIDGVAAIGKVRPQGVRQEFVLGLGRPRFVASGVGLMFAQHFL